MSTEVSRAGSWVQWWQVGICGLERVGGPSKAGATGSAQKSMSQSASLGEGSGLAAGLTGGSGHLLRPSGPRDGPPFGRLGLWVRQDHWRIPTGGVCGYPYHG